MVDDTEKLLKLIEQEGIKESVQDVLLNVYIDSVNEKVVLPSKRTKPTEKPLQPL